MQSSDTLASLGGKPEKSRKKAADSADVAPRDKPARRRAPGSAVGESTGAAPVPPKSRTKAVGGESTDSAPALTATKSRKKAADTAQEPSNAAPPKSRKKASSESTDTAPPKSRKKAADTTQESTDTAPPKSRKKAARVEPANVAGGDAPPATRPRNNAGKGKGKTVSAAILEDPTISLNAEIEQSRTLPTIAADTTTNIISAASTQLECAMFPAIKELYPKNVELKYVSPHYVQFTISNTNSTTCNFLRQQLMGTPTVRLYAAYSDTGEVDHSKLQLTCKYCPFWQYVVDNIKMIPIFQKISPDSKFSLHITNTTLLPLMVYSTDIVRLGGNMFPINRYPICELSPASELHVDNIRPIVNTSIAHAAHSNVAHVRVRNKRETNELIDDTGDFEISFKLLEGILPAEFVASMFASIHKRFVDIHTYLDSGKDGIVLCRMQNDVYQYSVHFTEPLMFVQYIVRLAQDAKHTIGTNMNPDDVSVSMYTDDIVPVLKTSCLLAIQNMNMIKTRLLALLA